MIVLLCNPFLWISIANQGKPTEDMDSIWGVAGSIMSVVGVIGVSVWSDKKGYRKIRDKIGNTNDYSLSAQHKQIEKVIAGSEKTLNEKSSLIFSKVDNIDKEITQNKVLHQNLNTDQKDIKGTLDRLLFDWQTVSSENKVLKDRIRELERDLQYERDGDRYDWRGDR